MKIRSLAVITAAAILALTVTGVIAFQERESASAQNALPELRTIIFQGNVTIAGDPSPNGFRVSAKIRDASGEIIYTSSDAIVGSSSDSRYTALVVGPFREGEGRLIEFWLDDQVISTSTSPFAPIQSGRVCLGCAWTLPILRSLNLDFPSAPVATPTPTPSPTPTVVILQPSLYSGRVLAGSAIPPDGTPIFAMVGDYVSPFSTIEDGRYQLVVNPIDEAFLDAQVIFFIGDLRAVQSAPFKGNEFLESFNLIFPDLPPTPTPTPVPPTPTPTPEPTRTPTPTPTPTPTATPTVTPTPIAEVSPTVEATATETPDESGGGTCSSNAGGPASTGMLALMALPFAFFVGRRLFGSLRRIEEED